MRTHKHHVVRGTERRMSMETADMLSHQQSEHRKSEQLHFPLEDKRRVVRREHTNGSTPSSRA